MAAPSRPTLRSVYRFASFELDATSGELRKHGYRVPLQDQPFRILCLLLDHPAELITREQIREALWSADTFVDFDRSLNKAMVKVRQALDDDADAPRFVETLPRRGYRFIGAVTNGASQRTANVVPLSGPSKRQHVAPRRSRRAFTLVAAPALAVFLLALLWNWPSWTPGKASATNGRRAMAVIEIENLSQDPSLKWLGDGVVDLLTTDLAQAKNLDVISSERVRNLISREVKPGESLPASRAQRVAQKAGAEIFISGTLLNMGQGFRLNLRVQDTASGKVLLADKVEGDSPQAIFSMVDEATAHIVSQLTPANLPRNPTPQART